MATESDTKTDKKAAKAADEAKADRPEAEEEREETTALAKDTAARDEDRSQDREDDGDDARHDDREAALPSGAYPEYVLDEEDEPKDSGRTGLGAGAAAIISAGLGLASITGTSLSEQMQARKQLMGQIESQMGGPGGGGGDQIQAMYGGPWHMTALFNGMFALAAVLVGGVLLGVLAGRAHRGGWARPVALGGLLLGVIGLVVCGGMFFDLFAPAPKIPGQ
ncbi:hypothetical protein [Streptomyces sp. ODS28]|uniref:GHMP family kinase ATP-binding protein n=1 Tax=Streptomyces sp. ODS28 TaxID=3136688 RepID=UPI0031F0416A